MRGRNLKNIDDNIVGVSSHPYMEVVGRRKLLVAHVHVFFTVCVYPSNPDGFLRGF